MPRKFATFIFVHSMVLLGASVDVCEAQAQRSEPTGRSAESQVVTHFRAAHAAMQAGEIDRAVKEYKVVLRLNPGLVEARVNLGLAYHTLGNYEQAIAELEKASRRNAELLPANFFLGIDYLKLGLNEKAATALRRVLRLDPSNREARRALAMSELTQDHYREAAREFRAVFSREANREDAWFNLGRDYLDMARRLAAPLSQKSRGSAWAHRFFADIWSGKQSWSDAAREYRVALSIDPGQSGLHTQLGVAYLRQAKAKEAEAEFQEELKLDPHHEGALLGLADAELLKSAPAAAWDAVSKIWELSPAYLAEPFGFPSVDLAPEAAARLAKDLEHSAGNSQSSVPLPHDSSRNVGRTAAFHFLNSALLRAAGEASRAEAEHEVFIRQFEQWRATRAQKEMGEATRDACSQHQEALCARWLQSRNRLNFSDNLLLGEALLTMQENEPASEAFGAALEQDKENPAAAYWLVRTYMRLADHCFEHLAESFPDSWRVHQLKAEIHFSRDDDKQAIEEYRLALQKNPGDPGLHEALGELYLGKKSLPEARVEVEKALQLNPTGTRTLYLLGRLCVAERKPAEGIPYLQKALRREPGLLEARATLGKAYLRVGKAELAVPELEKSLPLDHYGDLHFLLYQAYRDLAKPELAQQALALSQSLRKASAAADQARLAKSYEDD